MCQGGRLRKDGNLIVAARDFIREQLVVRLGGYATNVATNGYQHAPSIAAAAGTLLTDLSEKRDAGLSGV
jgi:hypothetical protein